MKLQQNQVRDLLLHSFVMDVIEVNINGAFRVIHGSNFFISILLTLAFSLVMQAVTYWKLKKIDMIELLKSVE